MKSGNQKIVILAESFPSKSRPNYNGGVEVVVDFLIDKYLEDKNINLFLISTSNKENDKELKEKKNLTIIRIPLRIKNISAKFLRTFQLIKIYIKMYKKLEQLKPDELIATNHSTYPIALLFKTFNKTKTTIYWHDLMGNNWIKYFGFTGILGYFVEIITSRQKSLSHITNSETTKDKLIKSIKNRNVISVLTPRTAVNYEKRKTQNKEKNRILMVGRLVNYKRTKLAIRIFGNLKKFFPEIKLDIVGDGPEKTSLLKQITRLKLHDSVFIHSKISNKDLDKLYSKANIFLHLSKIEGYGISIQEAAKYNCKIIASNISILKETTKGFKNIKLVNDIEIQKCLAKELYRQKNITKSLKVAMFIDGWEPVWGGGQTAVAEICKYLVLNHPCKIDLFVRALKNPATGKIHNENKNLYNGKLRIIRVGPASEFFNPIGRLLYIFLTPFYVKDNYDLIHAHAFMSAFPAKIVSILRNKKIILTIHGSGLKVINDLYKKDLSSLLAKIIEHTIFFGIKYDKQISVSRDFLKFKNKNSTVHISNGIDLTKFDKYRNTLDKSTFHILFVGRLSKQKGLIYLLKAFRKVIKIKKNIILKIVGDGPEKETLLNYTKKYKLETNVKFLGKLEGDKIINKYKSSNILILPSLYEGQALVMLEAWASKIPVIATPVGDSPYIIKENINGFFIKPKDAESIKNKIIEVSKNKNLENIGVNGYLTVKKNNNWAVIADQTYETYIKCILK